MSTGPRFYDYGPGTNFGGLFALRRDRREVLTLSYEAHQLHVLDGARANHFLQRAPRRSDRAVARPPRRSILTGEFFDRHTLLPATGSVEPAHFHFPQFRIALTWSSR